MISLNKLGGRGTLIFYDYTGDGKIDHVTIVLDNEKMLHPSTGSGKLIIKEFDYLDGSMGSEGSKYYMGIDWSRLIIQ